jgi:hypothetical protein
MQLYADQLERIDIKDLKRNNLLDNQCSANLTFQDGLELNLNIYVHPTYGRAYISILNEAIEKEYRDVQIDLATTECTFGGLRFLFRCPGTASHFCGNRVRTLYRVGYEFACRDCHNLKYSSSIIPKDMQAVVAKEIRMFHKVEKYKSSVKRVSYAGKPTKALLRLDAYYEKYIKVKQLSNALLKQAM